MRRATVSIPDELREALEDYRRDLEFSPSMAAVIQAALGEYLRSRGYEPSGTGKLKTVPPMYEEAPSVGGEKTASEIVVEDRR